MDSDYGKQISSAIRFFWKARRAQKRSNSTEKNNRGAVLGGRQMDGFAKLVQDVAMRAGVPEECILTSGCYVPGYYRSTKNWDLMIKSPAGQLIALIEFKSQIGSYGNNFNNRAEEAIGSSVDFWTAFRENAFPNQPAPWMGYLLIVGRDDDSTCVVSNHETNYPVMPVFDNTSYLERYAILCRRLVLERNYTSVGLAWTSSGSSYGDVVPDLSIARFLQSFEYYLRGVAYAFE